MRKNDLTLHEAIVVALINIDKESFQATIDEIAHFIEMRSLFIERKGNITLSKQIELRIKQSGGRYKYLFKLSDDNLVRLHPTPKSLKE